MFDSLLKEICCDSLLHFPNIWGLVILHTPRKDVHFIVEI